MSKANGNGKVPHPFVINGYEYEPPDDKRAAQGAKKTITYPNKKRILWIFQGRAWKFLTFVSQEFKDEHHGRPAPKFGAAMRRYGHL
ncbi:MAG TPA: hypothetical protein VEA59_03445 [Patescibacteria group bacterium]|nr:hypothetical protein [Patescibacteria group bacterium]